jgi:hypothetical protein
MDMEAYEESGMLEEEEEDEVCPAPLKNIKYNEPKLH